MVGTAQASAQKKRTGWDSHLRRGGNPENAHNRLKPLAFGQEFWSLSLTSFGISAEIVRSRHALVKE